MANRPSDANDPSEEQTSTYYDLNDDDFRGKLRQKSHKTRLRVKENIKNTTILRPDKSGMKPYSLVILPGHKAPGKQIHRDAGDGVKRNESRQAWSGARSESDRSCTDFHSATAVGQARPHKSPSNDSGLRYYQANSECCMTGRPTHASDITRSVEQEVQGLDDRQSRHATETHRSSKRYQRSKSNEVRKDVKGAVTQANAEEGNTVARPVTSAPISCHQHSNQRRPLPHGRTRRKHPDESDAHRAQGLDQARARRTSNLNLDTSSGDVRAQNGSDDEIRFFLDVPRKSSNESQEQMAPASLNVVVGREAPQPDGLHKNKIFSKRKGSGSKRRHHHRDGQIRTTTSRSCEKENMATQDIQPRPSQDILSVGRPPPEAPLSKKGLVTKIMRRDFRETELVTHDLQSLKVSEKSMIRKRCRNSRVSEPEPVKGSQRYRFLTSDGTKQGNSKHRTESSQGGPRLSLSPVGQNPQSLYATPKSDSTTKCVSGHLISPIISEQKSANVGSEQQKGISIVEKRSINLHGNEIDNGTRKHAAKLTDVRKDTHFNETESTKGEPVQRQKSTTVAVYSESSQMFDDGRELAVKSGEKQSSRILLALSSGHLHASSKEAPDRNDVPNKQMEMSSSEITRGRENSVSLVINPQTTHNNNGKLSSSGSQHGNEAYVEKKCLFVNPSKDEIVTHGSPSQLIPQKRGSVAILESQGSVFKSSLHVPDTTQGRSTIISSGNCISLDEKKEYPGEFDPLFNPGGTVPIQESGLNSLSSLGKVSQTHNAEGGHENGPSKNSVRLSLVNPRSPREDSLEGSSVSLTQGKVFYLTDDAHQNDGSRYCMSSGFPEGLEETLENRSNLSGPQRDPIYTTETYEFNPQTSRSEGGKMTITARSSNLLRSHRGPKGKHSRGSKTFLTLKGSSESTSFSRVEGHKEKAVLPLAQPSGSARPSAGEGQGGIKKERSRIRITPKGSKLGKLTRGTSQLADFSIQSSHSLEMPHQKSQLVVKNSFMPHPDQDHINKMLNGTQRGTITERLYSTLDRGGLLSRQLSRRSQDIGYLKHGGHEIYTQKVQELEARTKPPVYNSEKAISDLRIKSEINEHVNSERKDAKEVEEGKSSHMRGGREKMNARGLQRKEDQLDASESVGPSYKTSRGVSISEKQILRYRDEERSSKQRKNYTISADEALLASEKGQFRREKSVTSSIERTYLESRPKRKSRDEKALAMALSRLLAKSNAEIDDGALVEYPEFPRNHKNVTRLDNKKSKFGIRDYGAVAGEVSYAQSLHPTNSDLNHAGRRTVRFNCEVDRKQDRRRFSTKSRHTSQMRTASTTNSSVKEDTTERKRRSGAVTHGRRHTYRDRERRRHSRGNQPSDTNIDPMFQCFVDSDDKLRCTDIYEQETGRLSRSHSSDTEIAPMLDYTVDDTWPEYFVCKGDDTQRNARRPHISSESRDSRATQRLSLSSAFPTHNRRPSSADPRSLSTQNHKENSHSHGDIHNISNVAVETPHSRHEEHFPEDYTQMTTQETGKDKLDEQREPSYPMNFETIGMGSDWPRRRSSNKSTKSTDMEKGRLHGLKIDETQRKKHIYYRESNAASPAMHIEHETEGPNVQNDSQVMSPMYEKEEPPAPDTARLAETAEAVKFEPLYNEREQDQHHYNDSNFYEPRYEEQTYSAPPPIAPSFKEPKSAEPQYTEPRSKEPTHKETPSNAQRRQEPPLKEQYTERACNELQYNQSQYIEPRYESHQLNKTPYTKAIGNATFFNVASYIKPACKDCRFSKPPLIESNPRFGGRRPKTSAQRSLCLAKVPVGWEEAAEFSGPSKYRIKSKKQGDHFWESLNDFPETLQCSPITGGMMQGFRCTKSDILKRPLVSSPVLRGVSSRLRCSYKSTAHVYRDSSRDAQLSGSRRTPSSSELLRMIGETPTSEYHSPQFYRVSAKYVSPVGAKKSKGRKAKNISAELEEKKSLESFGSRSDMGYNEWNVESKTMDCRTEDGTETENAACYTAAVTGSKENLSRRPTGVHDDKGISDASSRKQSMRGQLEYNQTQDAERRTTGQDAPGNTDYKDAPQGNMNGGTSPNLGVSDAASKVKFVVPHSEEGFAQTYGAFGVPPQSRGLKSASDSGSKSRLHEKLSKQMSKDDLRQAPLQEPYFSDIGRPPSPRRYTQHVRMDEFNSPMSPRQNFYCPTNQGRPVSRDRQYGNYVSPPNDYFNTPMNSRQSPNDIWRTPSRDRSYANYGPSYDVGVGRSSSRDRQFGAYSQTSFDRYGSPGSSRQNLYSQTDIGRSTSKERQYGYFLKGASPVTSPMGSRQNLPTQSASRERQYTKYMKGASPVGSPMGSKQNLPVHSSSRDRQYTNYQPNSASSLPPNECYQDMSGMGRDGRLSPQSCPPCQDQQTATMLESPQFMDHSTSPTFGTCGCESRCTLVYQMTARFINFNGMRLPGGVRVLLDVSQNEAYIQLLSPLKEVYVSFYVSSVTFLNSTSAAGVAWSGLVCKDSKLPSCEDPAYPTRAFHSVANMPSSNECANRRKLVLVAQIVFTDPYQAHRFRIVLDTVKCAFSECDNLVVATAGDLSYQPLGPPPFPAALVDPMSLNLQQQGYPSPRQRVPQRLAVTMAVPPPPNAIGPFSESPRYHDAAVNKTATDCPCAPEPAEEAADGQENCGNRELFDPYAYELIDEKTLFCAKACLAKLDMDRTWLEMQQGYCKVIQCANGLGFVIGFESKCCITQYYLRRDTVFERAPKTKYGFIYRVVQSSDGGTEISEYLISFKNCEDASNFKAVVDKCHKTLMITADTGFDNTGRQGWSVCANNNCCRTRTPVNYEHHRVDNVSPGLGGYYDNHVFWSSVSDANWNNSLSRNPEIIDESGVEVLEGRVELNTRHIYIERNNEILSIDHSRVLNHFLFWIILGTFAEESEFITEQKTVLTISNIYILTR